MIKFRMKCSYCLQAVTSTEIKQGQFTLIMVLLLENAPLVDVSTRSSVRR